jgi:hypothetical protein
MTVPVQMTDTYVTVAIPRPKAVVSPVTARMLRRTATVYAAIWLVALAPTAIGAGRGWVAAGLGLAFPGGGFLYGGHPVLAAVAVFAVLLGAFLWWAMGIVLAAPLIWIATAALAGAAADEAHDGARIASLAAVPCLAAVFYVVHRLRFAGQSRRGGALNRELADVPFLVTGTPPLEGRLPVAEHSVQDLEHLRCCLDLALQPLDRFDGFDHLDQFREAATRYQLSALSYALSMSQFTRTPAFTGYLAEAQRNIIGKALDPKVWNYWALENAWGNLRLGRDPVDNPDNIMLTGYLGTQIGMYAALNDDRFSRPGALTFRRGPEEAYVHDFGSLARTTHRNFGLSAFTLFPCEPNWIYGVCNTFGVNTLLAHDRQQGTRYLDEIGDTVREAYESEFLRPDGRLVGVRSKLLGMSWNLWAGPMVALNTVFWLHAPYPDIAQRTWWLLRRSDLRIRDGLLELPKVMSSRLDPGNYRLGQDTFSQVSTLMAAREIGDEEIASAAQAALDARPTVTADGARRYRGSSVWTNSYAALGRFARHSALRDLLVSGVPEAWRAGPVLADAAYPDVLVARAVTDGHALDLTLQPGNGSVRTTLAIERLVPNRTYTVLGAREATVIADPAGRALLTVDLDRRHELRVC